LQKSNTQRDKCAVALKRPCAGLITGETPLNAYLTLNTAT